MTLSPIRIAAASLLVTGCAGGQGWGHATEASQLQGGRTVDIRVTRDGFEPARIEVNRGERATLVFTRMVEHTCAKRVIVLLDAQHEIERDLPIDQPVRIPLTFDRSGELGYTCGMKMLGGTIIVR